MMLTDLAQTVMDRCDVLGAISEEPGRLTRRSLSPQLQVAYDLVAGWMRAAGMMVSVDSAGSLIGTYPSDRSAAPTLIVGSHLDTVRDAGRYDGTLGVLVGLAAVEQLHRSGRHLPFAIDVIAFSDEEGLRYPSFLGSRVMSGRFDPVMLQVPDADGIVLADAIRAFGGDPELITQHARQSQDVLAYLEVHIEQGPTLEQVDLPVGVVTAISGLSRAGLTFTGTAGHAGTVPMALRYDALCAAAEFVLAAERYARNTPGLVATVGELRIVPGASNVIPGAATLSLDLRHQNEAVRLEGLAVLRTQAEQIAADRGLTVTWDLLLSQPAVPMAAALCKRLGAAIAAAGHAATELPSGAGHDAAIMASLTDAAMLFVRCKDGVSHNPAESVAIGDVAVAIDVVGQFLSLTAGQH
jgi:allantoate deiminase